jgi:hypothetical protein
LTKDKGPDKRREHSPELFVFNFSTEKSNYAKQAWRAAKPVHLGQGP